MNTVLKKKHQRTKSETLKVMNNNVEYVDHCLLASLFLKTEYKNKPIVPKIYLLDTEETIVHLEQYSKHFIAQPNNESFLIFICKHMALGVSQQYEYANAYFQDIGQWADFKTHNMYLVAQAVRHAISHGMIWNIHDIYKHHKNKFPLQYKGLIIKESDIGERAAVTGAMLIGLYSLLRDIYKHVDSVCAGNSIS